MGQPRSIEVGTRYGRWTVVGYDSGRRKYVCLCDCGTTGYILVSSLKRGESRSCGCLRQEEARKRATRHGASRSRGGRPSATYKTWQQIRQRCENPKNGKWKYYGARGIRVCERWHSFEAFLEDMGERLPKTTIDRIDPDGNYEPGNCRWADATTQSRNRRRTGGWKHPNYKRWD